ncbi:MAG: Glu-tRNA(Gln) amidotransferase GatDE subunit E [Thermoproteota archaeon]|nr:MAG: Glu-tRNA(Gln) amidotransferase GatDE subunit E [Candidatus Korarchaeota archaeon]
MFDYRALGLKVGIEIHQRLNTHKLFCNCPSLLKEEEPPLWFKRRLRVSRSELGLIDPAAKFEQLRDREFLYGVYPDTICEVELDECPPLPINEEALTTSIEVALMLKMSVIDEIHVMRKIVIDGSNTTGFQRTALVAVGNENSYIETTYGPVRIKTLCLEEESAFIVESTPLKAKYKLDRLGIPLVEIATEPDIWHPEQAKEAALRLGRLLRATGKVMRGIGTIRQDLNISISKGARQEVKGVQELNAIPEIINREIQRQISLLEIMKELKARGLSDDAFNGRILEVTDLLREVSTGFVKRAISRGERAYGVLLPSMKGILAKEIQPGRRFGTELSDYAKVFGGVGGIIHSDEAHSYGFEEDLIAKILKELGGGSEDAFVLVLSSEKVAKLALNAVLERARLALREIPTETRKPLPDGNTSFSRPLPGSERMYPETDIPPINSKAIVEKVSQALPEYPEDTIARLIDTYGISQELAELLFDSWRFKLFEEIASNYPKISPSFIATTLTSTLTALKREGIPIEKLEDRTFIEIFAYLNEGRLAKEAIPEVLAELALDKTVSLEEIVSERYMTMEQLDKIIDAKIAELQREISERGERAYGMLMGRVMAEVRGRIDGAVVSKRVKKKLSEFLQKTQK